MRSDLFTLIAADLRSGRRYFEKGNWAKWVVAFISLSIFLGLAVAAYFGFLRAFGFAGSDPLAGPLVLRYAVEASYALMFALAVLSFIVSSFATIFGQRETSSLVPFPIAPGTLFLHKFISTALLSSWPIFFLGLPSILALGRIVAPGGAFFPMGAALLALLAIMISLVGGLLSFVVAALSRLVSHAVRNLALLVALPAFVFALGQAIIPRSLFSIFSVASSGEVPAAEARIRALFAVWPTRPITDALLATVTAGGGSPAAELAWLGAAEIIGALLLLSAAARFFLPVWRLGAERGYIARNLDVPAAAKPRAFPGIFRWRHGFIFEQHLLTFLRTPADISRAVFLGALLFLYLLALRGLSGMAGSFSDPLAVWAMTFAFLVNCYFALTFGLRFAFPAFSLEGKAAWIFRTSPVHLHELFSWTYFFWAAFITLLAGTAAVFTVWTFGLPEAVGAVFVIAVLAASLGVVAICLGQGAIYPNYLERDPDTLSTTPSGLAATGLGLAYIAIIARYLNQFVSGYFLTGAGDPVPIFGIMVVAFVTIGVYWEIAPRAIDRMEIPG